MIRADRPLGSSTEDAIEENLELDGVSTTHTSTAPELIGAATTGATPSSTSASSRFATHTGTPASTSASKGAGSSGADRAPGITGVTASGITFKVPVTHDMVRTLFDPALTKTPLDILIVGLLLSNLVIYSLLPPSLRVPSFIAIYVFWRFGYNLGIGYLLYHQSHLNRIVQWAVRFKLFGTQTKLQRLMELEFSSKSIKSADFPVEFNTWIIYRKFVDLILMQDFTAYICLVVACSGLNPSTRPIVELGILTVTRWGLGTLFIAFNLWVKLDAHRIIKDYAWYWGDFFFLQKADLVFDGVFDMVPHPMYSVGYIGYYGFALLTKSYTVLLVSLFAHFLQFVFLLGVENPHIEKIYGTSDSASYDHVLLQKLHLKPLLFGVKNFHWYRSSDVLTVMVWMGSLLLPFAVRSRCVLFGLTVAVKLIHSIGLNAILHSQSTSKTWTKRFLKHDYSLYNAFESWTVLYNAFSSLTYTALVAFSLRELVVQPTKASFPLLRYILATLMIALQIWTQLSIFEEIGYYGWFYGDFFLPKLSTISRTGIYRYLNNPERIFGISGVWGLAVATYSPLVFALACVWTVNNLILLTFVEEPHMIKLYGEQTVTLDGGVSRTFKNLLPEQLKKESSPARRLSTNVSQLTGKLLRDLRQSKFQDSKDQSHLISLSQKIMTLSDTAVTGYSVTLAGPTVEKTPHQCLKVRVGQPLTVSWTAPADHDGEDWIGLYEVLHTGLSRRTTTVSSAGRWVGVSATAKYYHSASDLAPDALKAFRSSCVVEDRGSTGMVVFKGDLLTLEAGVYEFRYHLGNHHNVACISAPFEIVVDSIEISASDEFAERLQRLVSLVTPEEPYTQALTGKHGEKRLEQLVYLVSASTGLEVGETIIRGSKDARGLTQKLVEIKGVLDELCR